MFVKKIVQIEKYCLQLDPLTRKLHRIKLKRSMTVSNRVRFGYFIAQVIIQLTTHTHTHTQELATTNLLVR